MAIDDRTWSRRDGPAAERGGVPGPGLVKGLASRSSTCEAVDHPAVPGRAARPAAAHPRRDRAVGGELHGLHAVRPRVPGLVHLHRLAQGDARAGRRGPRRSATCSTGSPSTSRSACTAGSASRSARSTRCSGPRSSSTPRTTSTSCCTRRTGSGSGCPPCCRRRARGGRPSRPTPSRAGRGGRRPRQRRQAGAHAEVRPCRRRGRRRGAPDRAAARRPAAAPAGSRPADRGASRTRHVRPRPAEQLAKGTDRRIAEGRARSPREGGREKAAEARPDRPGGRVPVVASSARGRLPLVTSRTWSRGPVPGARPGLVGAAYFLTAPSSSAWVQVLIYVGRGRGPAAVRADAHPGPDRPRRRWTQQRGCWRSLRRRSASLAGLVLLVRDAFRGQLDRLHAARRRQVGHRRCSGTGCCRSRCSPCCCWPRWSARSCCPARTSAASPPQVRGRARRALPVHSYVSARPVLASASTACSPGATRSGADVRRADAQRGQPQPGRVRRHGCGTRCTPARSSPCSSSCSPPPRSASGWPSCSCSTGTAQTIDVDEIDLRSR